MTSFLENDQFFKKWSISGKPETFFKKSVIFRKIRRVKFNPFWPKSSGVKRVYFSRFFLKKSSKFPTSRAPAGVLKIIIFGISRCGPCNPIFGHFYPPFLTKNSLHFFLEIGGFLKNGRFRKTSENFKKNRGLSRPMVYAFYARSKLSANTKSDVKKH